MTDLLVARYVVNNTEHKEFYHKYYKAVRTGLKQRTLSTGEHGILEHLLGTHHLGSPDFHATFVHTLEDPERLDDETHALFKILGPGFMDIMPAFPFPGYMKTHILSEKGRHCVRCHHIFYIRDNGHTACQLRGDATARHTISPADVSYGGRFQPCNGLPGPCTTLADQRAALDAMMLPTPPFGLFPGPRRGPMPYY
ncbi:hypothetical protein M413DRAFT_14592 [Hebeloma cylindrosporum]|uniref:Uncharacterized protein n=1 Tax=Hebeloma cylindrosporum TaxID=76867 RepID=A0A0C3BVE5_HEBCY|nr:hypothetical protein M413DRAFT_14592 [Hebeloma cylindrosporum h7]